MISDSVLQSARFSRGKHCTHVIACNNPDCWKDVFADPDISIWLVISQVTDTPKRPIFYF